MQASHNPPSIIDCFCRFEQEKSDRMFLSEPVKGIYQDFSWHDAGQEIRKMASVIQSMGLQKGDKIAILSKNCAYWVMADLAIMLAGCVSVPLYPNISPNTFNQILIHSDAKMVFVGKLDNPAEMQTAIPTNFIQISFPFYPIPNTLVWTELTKKQSPLEGKPAIEPTDLACIIYTSGTTGNPKGVMHQHAAMSFAVNQFLITNPELKQETFFSYLPLCHVAEKMLVESGAIFTGSTIYFVESMDSFSKNLQFAKPTVFLAVPRIWEKMREEILKKFPQERLNLILKIPLVSSIFKKILQKKMGFSRSHFLFTGASPISASLLEWWSKLGFIIMEAYGMTENMALSHANRKGATRFGTVGTTYPGVDVRIGNDKEIQVKSIASMLGYYKEPDMTAESFVDGYFRTGDQGVISEDGYLTIIGRTKDLFKTSKGKYISPASIENKLLDHPFIEQVCVVGSGMPSAMAICTVSQTGQQTNANTLSTELKKHLSNVNGQLEHFEHLSKLVALKTAWTIENGVLTPTLKIKRNVIDENYQENYLAWQNAAETIILVI